MLQGYDGSSPINVKDGHDPSPRKTRKLSITLTLRTFFIYNTLGHDRIRILSRKQALFPNIIRVPYDFLVLFPCPHFKIHLVPPKPLGYPLYSLKLLLLQNLNGRMKQSSLYIAISIKESNLEIGNVSLKLGRKFDTMVDLIAGHLFK